MDIEFINYGDNGITVYGTPRAGDKNVTVDNCDNKLLSFMACSNSTLNHYQHYHWTQDISIMETI